MRPGVRQSLSSARPHLVSLQSRATPPLKLALHTLTCVLRNSSLYVAVGWLFGYFFTIGNVLSGLSASEQSCAAFSAANISWFIGVFSTCMIILMAGKLQREQFMVFSSNQTTAGPTSRRLTLLQCIIKLTQPTAPYLVFALVCAIGGDFLVYSVIPDSAHKYKPILYIAFFWGLYVLVMADLIVRNIYKTETVRGLLVSTLGSQVESPITDPSQTARIERGRTRRRRFWLPSARRFFRVYFQNVPYLSFALMAIVYVHAVTEFLQPSTQWELLGFGTGSIALKLMLQELAKHIMLAARSPVSRRVMVALVSTPTILVDTQVRMILLRQDNLNVSVAGTVLLAVFEIVLRAIKSMIVQRQTRLPGATKKTSQWWSFHGTYDLRVNSVHVMPAISTNPAKSDGTRTLSLVYSLNNTPAEYKAQRIAQERRRKIRVLHAAEIYADMYAEYIAIGCSYAILFYYRNHPKYQFTFLLSESPDQPTEDNGDREIQLLYFSALQMCVEVVVDFLACVFEAAHGVEFKSFNQNDPFLIFFLAMLTFSNVAIAAGMYQY